MQAPLPASVVQLAQPTVIPFTLHGVSMTYVFAFDVGSEESLPKMGSEAAERLREVVAACFSVAEGRTFTFQGQSTPLLEIYKRDMYEKRFRPELITSLQTLVVEFTGVTATGLSRHHDVILAQDVNVIIHASATLHRMGVGSLVLWIEPAAKSGLSMETLLLLRDANTIRTRVDWRIGSPQALRLNGDYSVADIARFLIINLCSALYSLPVTQIASRIQAGDPLRDIHAELCAKIPGEITLSSHIDPYPIFHIDFQSSTPAIDAASLAGFVQQRKGELRGLITGDLNWDKKKATICESHLKECDYTTRDSIRWYTHPNGSLKIYSSSIETNISVSKALITFELEFVVAMRHFAYSILRNLNSLTESNLAKLPVKKLAKLRDREMRRLDEFYNLDFLQKDTTLSRLEKYKSQFRINNLFHIATQKFESLNLYMTTQYQDAGFRRNLLLSIVFGVFGAGQVIWGFLMYGIESKVLHFSWHTACLITVGCMTLVGVTIYLISRLRTF